MPEPTQSPAAGDGSPTNSAGNIAWLVIAWLWAGIPLAWGLSQTIMTSLALFK